MYVEAWAGPAATRHRRGAPRQGHSNGRCTCQDRTHTSQRLGKHKKGGTMCDRRVRDQKKKKKGGKAKGGRTAGLVYRGDRRGVLHTWDGRKSRRRRRVKRVLLGLVGEGQQSARPLLAQGVASRRGAPPVMGRFGPSTEGARRADGGRRLGSQCDDGDPGFAAAALSSCQHAAPPRQQRDGVNPTLCVDARVPIAPRSLALICTGRSLCTSTLSPFSRVSQEEKKKRRKYTSQVPREARPRDCPTQRANGLAVCGFEVVCTVMQNMHCNDAAGGRDSR